MQTLPEKNCSRAYRHIQKAKIIQTLIPLHQVCGYDPTQHRKACKLIMDISVQCTLERTNELLGDPEVTANIYCKSRNLPNTDTQIYSTDLR